MDSSCSVAISSLEEGVCVATEPGLNDVVLGVIVGALVFIIAISLVMTMALVVVLGREYHHSKKRFLDVTSEK